jgi:hypothetical protein
MRDLPPDNHVFRHIKASWIDGEFVEPAAFRLREEDGKLEDGLSVNWVEFFGKPTPQEAVSPLRETLVKNGRTVSKSSRFALLNVQDAKNAAAEYAAIRIFSEDDVRDPSHSLVVGYEEWNDQVSEALAKVVICTFPAQG